MEHLLLPKMFVDPAFLGTKNLNKAIEKYPKYTIEKIDFEEFELKFFLNNFKDVNIKVEIVPINCDHEILWLIEAEVDKIKYFSGLISDVNSNLGLWRVQAKDMYDKKYNILSLDINNKDNLVHSGVIRKNFTISIKNKDFNKNSFLSILVCKI